MNENDILWQVIYIDEDLEFRLVEGVFQTKEEANEYLDECVKERRYSDSFDIYPKDNHWEYYVESVTRQEVMGVRQRQYERLLDSAREKFWNHCGEHFTDCCRKMLLWLDKRVRELADQKERQQVKRSPTLFAPWQTFHGESKVLAYIRFGRRHKKLSLYGQFAGRDLSDTIIVGIRHFDSCQAFLEWTGNIDDAVNEFVFKMREERIETF